MKAAANSLLWKRVSLAREGSAVERCHAHDHLKSYSVGHHTLDLITLLTLCWQAAHKGALPRAELLVAAAFHDVPERITGDVPSPIKDMLDGALDAMEARALKWLGVDPILTEEEAEYLLAADRLELCLWAIEEGRRGNRTFMSWVNDYVARWKDKPLPSPFMRVLDHACLTGSEHLSWNRLKEIIT